MHWEVDSWHNLCIQWNADEQGLSTNVCMCTVWILAAIFTVTTRVHYAHVYNVHGCFWLPVKGKIKVHVYNYMPSVFVNKGKSLLSLFTSLVFSGLDWLGYDIGTSQFDDQKE